MIGNFDDSNVVFGCLPSCLKNGTAPSNTSFIPNGVNRLKFPLYNGPKASPIVTSSIQGCVAAYNSNFLTDVMLRYESGKIRMPEIGDALSNNSDNGIGALPRGFQLEISQTNSWSSAYTVDFSNPVPIALDSFWFLMTLTTLDFSMQFDLAIGYGFTSPTAPFAYTGITIGEDSYLVVWDLPVDFSGIQQLVLTKSGNTFQLFQDSVLCPIAVVYGDVSVLENVEPLFFPTDSVASTWFTDDFMYVHGDGHDPISFNPGHMLTIPAVSSQQFPNWMLSYLHYDKALAQQEINTLYNLGPDLGGLLGYDNSNGTMTLLESQISVSPALKNFGAHPKNSTVDQTVIVSNLSPAPVIFGNLSGLSAPYSLVNDTLSDSTLHSLGDSSTVVVRYHPTALGATTDTLTIPSSDPSGPYSFSVDGTCQEADISVSVTSLDFGLQAIHTPTSKTVTVTNIGNIGLVVQPVSIPYPFNVFNDSVSDATIAPLGTAQFSVSFVPGTIGNFHDSLTVNSNDPDTLAVGISVSGDGIRPSNIFLSSGGRSIGGNKFEIRDYAI